MASKKKSAAQWREGDRVALYGKINKVVGEDGREKLAVLLEGAVQSAPVLISHEYVEPA